MAPFTDPHSIALALAGIIGCGVALLHGVLTQRLVVRPVDALAVQARTPPVIRRLVAALLQFSTYNWFLGGLALLAAAAWLGPEARLAIALLVGSSYLFGAVGNCWATRGRHVGWMLYAVALGLMAFGVS